MIFTIQIYSSDFQIKLFLIYSVIKRILIILLNVHKQLNNF